MNQQPQIQIQNFQIDLRLGNHHPNIITTAGITAFDFQGTDISNSIQIDDRSIDYDHQGEYRVPVTATDAHGNQAEAILTVNIVKMLATPTRQQSNNSAVSPTKNTHKNSRWLWGVIIILLLAAGFFWWNGQQQKNELANQQSEQSSASLKSQSNKIDQLAKINSDLSKEIATLKQAVKDYQSNNNQQTFQNQINDLKAQNQNLQNELSQLSTSQTVNKTIDSSLSKLNDTLNQLGTTQSATEAQQALDKANLNSRLDGINNAIQSIKDYLGI